MKRKDLIAKRKRVAELEVKIEAAIERGENPCNLQIRLQNEEDDYKVASIFTHRLARQR